MTPVEQIAQLLNEQGAEITAIRTILLGLVARVIVADPIFAEEQLEQMQADALGALERSHTNPANTSNDEQLSQGLAVLHVESFFRHLAVAVSAMRTRSGQSGRN